MNSVSSCKAIVKIPEKTVEQIKKEMKTESDEEAERMKEVMHALDGIEGIFVRTQEGIMALTGWDKKTDSRVKEVYWILMRQQDSKREKFDKDWLEDKLDLPLIELPEEELKIVNKTSFRTKEES